jgi:hypothetical protein
MKIQNKTLFDMKKRKISNQVDFLTKRCDNKKELNIERREEEEEKKILKRLIRNTD